MNINKTRYKGRINWKVVMEDGEFSVILERIKRKVYK